MYQSLAAESLAAVRRWWRRKAHVSTTSARTLALPGWLHALKWVSRVGSVAVVAILIPFAFSGGSRPTGVELAGVLMFPIGLVAGFAISWWREGVGAVVSLTSVVGIYVLLSVMKGAVTGGPYFALLALPAVGFGLFALLRRRPA